MKQSKERKLIDQLAAELLILRAAWIIAGDDDRRSKFLCVSPSDVRRWSALVRQAGPRIGLLVDPKRVIQGDSRP